MASSQVKKNHIRGLHTADNRMKYFRSIIIVVIIAMFIQSFLDEVIAIKYNINDAQFRIALSLFFAALAAVLVLLVIRVIARRALQAEKKRRQTEEQNFQLASIIESSEDAIIGKTLDGIITSWNYGAEKMYGYTQEEAIHQPISMIIPADRQEEMTEILNKIRNGENIDNYETIRKKKDGSLVDVSISVSSIYNEKGLRIGISSIARDISRRKKMETELRDSEERFERYMSNIPAAVFMKDKESRLLYSNPMLDRLFGWKEPIGKLTSELLPQDIAEQMMADDRKVIEKGIEIIHEKVVDVHGSEYFFETHKFTFSKEDGEILLGGISLDETQRKKAEEQLRRSEDQIRLLLNSTAEAIYGIDLDGNCTFCNNACLQILGYTCPDDLLGKNMHQQIHSKYENGTSFPVEECRIYRAFKKGDNAHVDDEVLWRANGTSFPAEYWSYPQRRDGKVIGAVVTFIDITERKRTQELLLTQTRRLGDILEGTNVGTWEWNIQTGETSYNERWAEIIGYTLEELAPYSINIWKKFSHPDDLKLSDDLLKKHFNRELEYYECEVRMLHKNGSWIWVHDRGKVSAWTEEGKPLVMSGTHQDITKRKQIEADRELLINDLQKALADVKMLSGLIPICASCKKIRDDTGYWNVLETYIHEHSEAQFSHGLCPECAAKLYPDLKSTKLV